MSETKSSVGMVARETKFKKAVRYLAITMALLIAFTTVAWGIASGWGDVHIYRTTMNGPNGKTVGAMLIFSGTTLPFEVMPVAMQKIIGIFPMTQGIQLMKATFLGLPTENVLLPVVVMGAVILICFGISAKCFKWE